jgi:hypothetical protein
MRFSGARAKETSGWDRRKNNGGYAGDVTSRDDNFGQPYRSPPKSILKYIYRNIGNLDMKRPVYVTCWRKYITYVRCPHESEARVTSCEASGIKPQRNFL